MRKTAAKLLTVAALATSLATVVSGTAVADPAAGVTPASVDIVGVGSDTTQAVFNQFSTDYNAFLGTGSTAPHLYSWDSTGSPSITPKSGASSITRPNGSGAGITAVNTNTSATVDFGRSSRANTPSDPTNLDFVAFAKDAITWASQPSGSAPASLSATQLNAIFSCTARTWHDVDASLPSVTIKPFLPQANSGTRQVFLAAIGNTSVGSCVVTGPQENEGTDSRLADPNAVFPYSIGHYIGQVNGHGTVDDAPGTLTLRSLTISGVAQAPITSGKISTPVANSVFGRVLYNVFRDADWTATDTHGNAIQAIFGPGGWICTNTTAKADIANYGFLVTGACGDATLT